MSQIPHEVPSLEQLSELMPAYEFDFLIAQGGMGAVFKARQRSLDRDVAIKILPPELGADPLFRESFETEAKAMARLSHNNLLKVYDYGDADGLLFIAMEYVHGSSLHHSAAGKKIDSRQAVEIVLGICCGLAHAHENGTVHRDIKPSNIFLNQKCEPKIGDFGLARPTGFQSGGLVMGTPGYAAPEVMSHPEEGDRRSDIFAIGVILKEMLTGLSAIDAGFPQATFEDFRLGGICAKATAADPAMRYTDVSELCHALERWQQPHQATRVQISPQRQTIVAPNRQAPSPRREAPLPRRPSRAPAQSASSKWSLLKNCAAIASLAVTSYLTWNLYMEKGKSFGSQAQHPEKEISTAIRVVTRSESQSTVEALASSNRY